MSYVRLDGLIGCSSKSCPLKISKSKFPQKFLPFKAYSSVPRLCDADYHWFEPWISRSRRSARYPVPKDRGLRFREAGRLRVAGSPLLGVSLLPLLLSARPFRVCRGLKRSRFVNVNIAMIFPESKIYGMTRMALT